MSCLLETSSSFFPNISVLEYASLYSAGVLWTIIYDTIYGHQDKKDDKKINIKSMALLWGNSTVKKCLDLQRFMFLLLTFHGVYFEFSPMYYPSLCLVYYFCVKLLRNVNVHSPKSCNEYFQKMKLVGILLMIVFAIGNHTTLKEYFIEEKLKMKEIINN